MRSTRRAFPFIILAALPGVACDSTVAPPDTGSDAPELRLLIGQSPLVVLDRTNKAVEVTLEVNRGLTEVKIEDKFRLVNDAALWWGSLGTPIHVVPDPAVVELIGVKDTELRQGNSVAIAVCIDIPAPDWEALVAADERGEDTFLHVLSELVMTDGAGADRVLETLDVMVPIDPKGDG